MNVNSRKRSKQMKTRAFLEMNPEWVRRPHNINVSNNSIEVITESGTDLWQRTYYGFTNDNAPVFQTKTDEKYFSFIVKTKFESKDRFDQCGVAMYLDSDNWFKASIEYENENYQRLGSVVTNNGYSDWATTDISSGIKEMWYRFSRRESDFCIECGTDGKTFRQMRIFHMFAGSGTIKFGIYAASPTTGSFRASFTDMIFTECQWKPDAEWKQ